MSLTWGEVARTWFPALTGIAVLGLWPFVVQEYEVPIAIGTALWIGVFILLAWHLLRNRGLSPDPIGV